MVPANAFAIPFGLAGLSMVWRNAAESLGAPGSVPAIVALAALVIWGVLLVGYLRGLRSTGVPLAAELSHPVTAPFLSLVPLTLIVLVPELELWAPTLTAWVAWPAMIAAVGLGAWLTGTWLGAGVPERTLHSGFYLPTVAAGLLSATALVVMGLSDMGMMAWGMGAICWLLLGSIINNRNMIVQTLPPALLPTMAIDVAPVVVAGNSWFALNGGRPDTTQLILAGFAVLMILVQVRLYFFVFRKLSFGLSFWAFTFSYCAVASYILRWLATSPGTWQTAAGWVIVAGITAFLVWVAARSVLSLRAGTFFPAAQPRPEDAPAP